MNGGSINVRKRATIPLGIGGEQDNARAIRALHLQYVRTIFAAWMKLYIALLRRLRATMAHRVGGTGSGCHGGMTMGAGVPGLPCGMATSSGISLHPGI